jgi:cell division protein FtsW
MRKHLIILGCCVAALSILGIVMLYSTVFTTADAFRFRSQLNWFGVGLILLPILVLFDYGWLQRRAVVFGLAGVFFILLVLVFIPGIRVQTNGANRWVRGLGQPSEFAKPAVIIVLASWFARRDRSEVQDLQRGFVIPLLMGMAPAVLIFVEPDWGTAILLGMVTLVMLVLAGARWSYLAVTVAAAGVLLSVLLACNPTRLERLLTFLDPEAHRHGAGWQVWQSLLAIGSGGLSGHFLDGSLHKFGFVPEQQTDFIFARIGEETGLWGTSLVVLLYMGILYSGLQIMKQARERFGYFLAFGCTVMVVLQAWINMAVATGLVPNKGLPLPFVSYGGSGLLAMLTCIGLLGSVAWHCNVDNRARGNSAQLKPIATQLWLL